MAATKTIRVEIPGPHPGQVRLLKEAERFNVLRCGRRFGKTILGRILITDTALQGMPVGWFAPEYRYLKDTWRWAKSALAPIIRTSNASEHRIELITGGSIDMFSTKNNDDVARGKKYKRVVFDEAGIMPNLKAVWRGAVRPTLTDYSGDAWFLGTSKPAYPVFNQLFLRQNSNPHWKSFQLRTVDNPFIDPAEVEAAREEMPEWQFLEEFEGIPSEAGLTYFAQGMIDTLREGAMEPMHQGELLIPTDNHELDIAIKKRSIEAVRWREVPKKGVWKLWCDLRNARPPRGRNIAISCDLSNGVGASNTIFSVGDCDTRRKIAEFASPFVTPERAARIAAAAGIWFGGASGKWSALLNFEYNGPGEAFLLELRRLGYPRIYRRRKVGKATEGNTDDFGWFSTPQTKETLLSDYRAALGTDRFYNPSDRALEECMTYITDEYNRIVCSEDLDEADESGARRPHADRVIADAILYLTMRTAPRLAEGERDYDPTSLDALRKRQDKLDRQRKVVPWDPADGEQEEDAGSDGW